jgi:uncharacterized membrane protein
MNKPHTISAINAFILIVMGLWGYFVSETPSLTALIPVIGGFILLLLNNGLRKENAVIAHIAVIVTLALLIGLIKPFIGVAGRNDIGGLFRVMLMMASTIGALIAFIKNFRDVRKQREAKSQN